MTDVSTDELAKRRVPALIAYLSPFRIIEAGNAGQPWSATIEQVNRGEWDYVALHEVVGGLDVGLDAPYHMVISRDGGLALPPIPALRSDQAAVNFFNRCLAALLLGGVYCEAINHDGLDLGSVIDWKYVRSQKQGSSAANRFHHHIRYKSAGAFEAIQLYKPRSESFDALQRAMKTGLECLEKIQPVQGEYLLKGVTGLARRNWGNALANLWIVTEQLLEALWDREIVLPARGLEDSKTRVAQLSDTRSWSAATRIEMLHQKEVFDLTTLSALSKARKARNDLSHRGIHPTQDDVTACYSGVTSLISAVLVTGAPPLFKLELSDHAVSDPFAPPRALTGTPAFWMPIPKLPGEEQLEKDEAQAFAKSRDVT